MTKKQLEFGSFRFDEANECVWEGGKLIQLRPKAYAILKYLIQRPKVLVTKQQLLDDVWPDTFVSDAVLKDCIRQLREALRDDAKSPTYIETAHRRGYRFIAAVAEPAEPPLPAQMHAVPAVSSFTPYHPPTPVTTAEVNVLDREQALARLHGWLGAALSAKSQIVFVTGEAGIGKTTVVDSFLAQSNLTTNLLIAGLLCFLITGVVRAQDSKPGNLNLIFEGNKVFSDKELLDVANKCLAEVSRSRDKYEPEVVEYCLYKVRFFLSHKGYLRATVGPLREETEGGSQVVIPVEEGARFRLGKIRIRGAKVFTSSQILEMSGLKPGDIADGEAIDKWLFDRANKAYANLGYIEYTAEAEPDFRLTSAGSSEGVVDLTITVEEGNVFIVNSIKFEGNGTIPADVLQRELLVRAGDVFSKERFEESLKRFNELELFEKIDVDKDVEYKSDRESPRLDITIRVKKKPTNF